MHKSFDRIMAEKASYYLNEEGEPVTEDEVMRWPRWRRVWNYWLYCERYEDFTISMSLEDCKTVYGDD